MINGGQKMKSHMETWIIAEEEEEEEEEEAPVRFYMVLESCFLFFSGEKPDLSQIQWDQWLTAALLLNCRVHRENDCISP